jgi:hypothetical protein
MASTACGSDPARPPLGQERRSPATSWPSRRRHVTKTVSRLLTPSASPGRWPLHRRSPAHCHCIAGSCAALASLPVHPRLDPPIAQGTACRFEVVGDLMRCRAIALAAFRQTVATSRSALDNLPNQCRQSASAEPARAAQLCRADTDPRICWWRRRLRPRIWFRRWRRRASARLDLSFHRVDRLC